MKVAIVLMKGFDGCGVSRFALEHRNELIKTDNICDIYSFNNKYARSVAHGDISFVKWFDHLTDFDFSNYDIFVLNSYPKDFDEKDFEYYKSLKCKKVAMMHEILRQNIGRIDRIWDWLRASDVISSFSSEMDFTNDLFEKYPDSKYFSFKMAMSDDDLDNLYNNSLNIEKKNRLIYFGRWTTMKDPHRLFEYKKIDPSLDLSAIGIERSIGAFHDIFKDDLCEAAKLSMLNDKSEYDNFAKNDNLVQIFPPVNRNVALDILKESLFGASFYSLSGNRVNNLGNRMEYTQIEISSVCLPVFDLEWGKHTIDNVTGKTFYELGNNAIYSDENNLQASVDEMNYLSTHLDKYNERRKNIFDLVKRNYGSTENIKYFYNTVLNGPYSKNINTKLDNNHKEDKNTVVSTCECLDLWKDFM